MLQSFKETAAKFRRVYIKSSM